MDVKEYLQSQFASARRVFDATLEDITHEQINWTPPGTVNPVRAALLHVVGGEDRFVQAILQGKPMLWQEGNWGEKIGVAQPPGRTHGWEGAKSTEIRLAPVLEYRDAVRAATDEYLSRLTPDELERTVDFMGVPRCVADVLAILTTHIAFHAGEVAAVKGVQGAKGLPY